MLNKNKEGAAFDSVILTVVRMFTFLISFAITRILSEKLSLELYGEYSASRVVMDIGRNFCILGLIDAANYFYIRSSGIKERQEIVGHIILIEAAVSLVFAGVILLLRNGIADYFGISHLDRILFIIVWIPLFMNLVDLYQIFFISIQKARIIGLFSLAANLVKLIYTTIVCMTTADVSQIFLCMLAAEIIQVTAMMLLFSHLTAIPLRIPAFRMDLVKKILAFAIPMGAFIWVNTLNREIDKLIVGNLGTVEELALYSNAAKQLPFDVLTGSFMTVLIPFITSYLAKGNTKAAASVFSCFLYINMIGVWNLAGGMFLAPEGVISLLYGEKYIVVKNIFLIYILVDMIRFAQTSILFSAMHRSHLLLRYSIATLAANTVLNLLLYPVLGLMGPALVTLAVNIAMAVYLLYKGAALIGQPVGALLPGTVLLDCLARLAVAMGAGLLIHWVVRQGQFIPEVDFLLTYTGYFLVVIAVNFKKVRVLMQKINQYRMG